MKINNKNILRLIFAFTLTLLLFSCRDNNEDVNQDVTTAAPVITSISPSLDANGQPSDLSSVKMGYAGNIYVIRGSGFSTLQHIYFNDKESVFNPNLVTENTIFVTVDQDTPYSNASNKLKLVTKYGTTEYDFIIAPPAPLFTSFGSINASAGDTITLYGNYFLDPVVKVGDTEATVVSSTLTEIKVIMPANSANKYVSVTTLSGTVTAPQAVGSALYDDVLQGDAGHWTWSGAPIVTNYTEDKYQGAQSMKIPFGGWDGADFKFNSRDVSQYKAFRIRVKSTSSNAAASLKLVFGGWAYQITKTITSDWTYIEIPFSEIGNPTTFDQITFQESGGFGGNTILIDDMGFVLK